MNDTLDKKFEVLDEKMSNKFDSIKEELAHFKTDQTENSVHHSMHLILWTLSLVMHGSREPLAACKTLPQVV